MLFHSMPFLLLLTATVLAVCIVNREHYKKLCLLIASYVFYIWWNPAFIVLIVASTAIDFVVGGALEREQKKIKRQALLALSIVANLGILGYFKYYGFFAENLLPFFNELGFSISWTTKEIVLPLGISFYTFQSLSYTIDRYRGQIPRCSSALDFALYVAFFPQLVAGPIVRASHFLPQLNTPLRLRIDREVWILLLRGFTKKILIADSLARVPDAVFAEPEAWPSAVIIFASVCFSVQIYCDFSGYSNIARGLARLFGFEIPENFKRPYFANNPREFWRRWHISLSEWFRDYLYIPLGGSHKGPVRTSINILLTMLLAGLWHGASWNFVLWGLVHGFALILYRSCKRFYPRGVLGIVLTQYFVLLAWLPFRIVDSDKLSVALGKFLLPDFSAPLFGIGLSDLFVAWSSIVLCVFLLLHIAGERGRGIEQRMKTISNASFAGVYIVAGVLFVFFWPLAEKPFIYFQF